MSYILAIILGLVQGLAEFLPISSSGHLVLFQQLFQNTFGVSDVEHEYLLFDVLLHLGTLFAVFVAFRKLILKLILEFFVLLKNIFTGKFSYKKTNPHQKMIIMIIISLLPLFFILPFKSEVEGLFTSVKFVGFALLFTSIILWLSDRVVLKQKDKSKMTMFDAIVVGIFQAIAVVPGVSRSGATISAGLFRGFTRELAIEFSFVMSIPAILGAALLQIKDAIDTNAPFFAGPYLVGMVIAAVVGYLAIQFLRYIMKINKFSIFAYYCAVIGLISIVWGFLK